MKGEVNFDKLTYVKPGEVVNPCSCQSVIQAIPDKSIPQGVNPEEGIKQVSSVWTWKDTLSTLKVRLSFGRMNYSVTPGLYKIGAPGPDSDVFVSCNFRLSFDILRRALHGLDAWILVLDTKGINVWCAAGKGTFSTAELARRIRLHGLEKVVNHRRLIVPQLGATGIAAHEVKNLTGFRVIYGPVRADDIKTFVTSNYKATPEMRLVRFNLWDRAKLIPVEFFNGKYYFLVVAFLFFLFSGLNRGGYSFGKVWSVGSISVLSLFAAYVAGCVITPLLLPYIPFKRFSLKGLAIGWILTLLFLVKGMLGTSVFEIISWFLIMGSVSSYMAMNFTGTSTFTSLSGVRKEMKWSLPLQIGAAATGTVVWLVTRFIQ